jgi:redox-sensing transcriptional repressor
MTPDYTQDTMEPLGVPLPTLRRLPLYLRLFEQKAEAGEEWLSSEAMARELGFGAIQVRKDLGAVGALGSPKRGFPVAETCRLLGSFLGAEDFSETFLVGTGPLARAVLADEGLAKRGFRIAAIFEPDPRAPRPSDRKYQPLERLPELAKRMGTRLAILAVEPCWAETAAEVLARSGIAGVLDLTGVTLAFPKGMAVVRESFSAGLSALAGNVRTRKVHES